MKIPRDSCITQEHVTRRVFSLDVIFVLARLIILSTIPEMHEGLIYIGFNF